MIKSKLLLLFINTDMHSRVEILVHVAPVDPTRSNQTNPREKMLEGLRSSPSQCLTAKELLSGPLR